MSRDDQADCDRFAAKLQLPYALVGDPEGRIVRAYGVRWALLPVARRVTFILGRDRLVRDVYRSELAPASHARHACEALAG